MTQLQLWRLERRLYSEIPLIGRWIHQKAIEALVADGSVAAVRLLAEAVTKSPSAHVREAALAELRQLEDWRAISELCEVWAETRHPALEKLMIEREWVASVPPDAKTLSALKQGRLDEIADEDERFVGPLIQACEDVDPTIAQNARQVLGRLTDPQTRDLLCRLVIERDLPAIRQIVLTAGYAPTDEQQRAVYFFLTEQWERYEKLDFDRRLLRNAYAFGDGRLRRRIRERMRAGGRVDYLTAIAGEDYTANAGQMSEGELELTVQTLTENEAWETLWPLAFEAPFHWSVTIVRRLTESGWRPESGGERATFEKLANLATSDIVIEEERLQEGLPPALLKAQARVPGRINDVAFSPTRPVIAIGTGARKLVLWNYQQARPERVIDGFDHSIGHVTFTGDGTLLCGERTNAVETPCAIYRWDDEARGERVRLGAHLGSVTSLVPTGATQALSTGRGYNIILWDVERGREIKRQEIYYRWPRGACVSRDHRLAAILDKGFHLRALPSLEHLALGFSSGVIRSATFMPDNETVLAGGYSGQVIIYEHRWERSFSRDLETLPPHQGRVEGVAVLGDRDGIITAGSEGDIRFFTLNQTPIATVRAPLGHVTSLHVSPDETFMAVGSSSSALSFWDLRSLSAYKLLREPLANVLPDELSALKTLIDDEDLPDGIHAALRFADCAIRHRCRFDVVIEDAPTIMIGEFDIEIE